MFGRLVRQTTCTCTLAHRAFHESLLGQIKATKLPPRPRINEDEITEVFLKGGTGPGGQKINKTNSKVQLKHLPTGIVVACQATRSREQNRKKAREILAMKVQDHYDPENSRVKAIGDYKRQKSQSKSKKTKRKYRELDEERKKRELEQVKEEQELLKKLSITSFEGISITKESK